MAATVSIPPSPATEKLVDAAASKRHVAVLRAELEADDDPARRAALSHELARGYERALDTSAAARDALAATHHAAGFIEPLEALVRIAIEHRSRGNLSKLLERLLRVARTPDERERAALELLGHHLEAGELERADEITSALLGEAPQSGTAWLGRALVASHAGDEDKLLAAYLGRVSSALSATYRAELLERAGQRSVELGSVDEGLSMLQQAIDEAPSYARLRALESAARASGRPEVARRAAESLAELLARAHGDAEAAEAAGVPRPEREASAPLEASLRAALHAAEAGDPTLAEARVLGLLDERPGDLLLLALARRFSARRSEGRSDAGTHDAELAWLARVLAALETTSTNDTSGDTDRALVELESALLRASSGVAHSDADAQRVAEALPESLLPRLFALRATAASGDGALAAQQAVEAGARLPARSRASLLLASAATLATVDPAAATRALEAAREAGMPMRTTRRLLRLVARLAGSSELVLAADLTLLDGDGEPDERTWEALRLAWLSGDRSALDRVLGTLPDTSALPALVPAFLLRSVGELTALKAVRDLGPDFQRAFGLIDAARDFADPAGGPAAVSRLEGLIQQDATDVLAAAALVAHLEQTAQSEKAASVLSRTAEALSKADAGRDLVDAWATRAAFAFARTGRNAEALSALEQGAAAGAGPLGDGERYLLASLGAMGRPRALALRESMARAGDADATLEVALDALERDPKAALDVLASVSTKSEVHALLSRLLAAQSASSIDFEAGSASDDERALLAFEAARSSRDPQAEFAAARAWFEIGGDPSEPARLDAALLLAISAQRVDAPEQLATALETIAEALDDDALRARSKLALVRSATREDDRELARRELLELEIGRPPAPNLGWSALEAHPRDQVADRVAARLRLAGSLAGGDATDPDVITLRVLAAFEQLGEGDAETALATFRAVQLEAPADPTIWAGVAAAAARVGRADLEVVAVSALAEKCNDDARAASLWERAGVLYEDHLSDPSAAETAFCAALSRSPENAEAFARVYRRNRVKGDEARLVELIDSRLDVTRDDAMRAELLWEKARLCRSLGRRASALRALDLLLELDPNHLPALSLAGEMHLVDQRFERAAEALRAISIHRDTPPDVVAQSGLHAVDLLERLHRSREAVALLEQLERQGVERGAILERRARNAARAEAWDLAYRTFTELADAGENEELRAEGARMMLAIQRDHLQDPRLSMEAATRVLRTSPLDEDALDVMLSGEASEQVPGELLRAATDAARDQLRSSTLFTGRIARLVDLSERAGPEALYRVALGTFSLTGVLGEDRKRRLDAFTPRELTPRGVLTDADIELVASAAEKGRPAALARRIAPVLARLTRPSLESLGLGSLTRVDPYGDHPLREHLIPWARLVGLDEFEVHLGGNDAQRILCFEAELPTLVIGEGVPTPFGARDRARLASAVFGFARGVGALSALSLEEGARWLAALALLSGRSADGDADVKERAATLSEILARDVREEVEADLLAIEAAGDDPLEFFLGVRASAARMACLVHGDPSILRHLPRLVPEDPQQRRRLLGDVVSFAFSNEFEPLREKVGLTSHD